MVLRDSAASALKRLDRKSEACRARKFWTEAWLISRAERHDSAPFFTLS